MLCTKRHFRSLSGELPSATDALVGKSDLKAAASVHLINNVGHRTEAKRFAIEHEPTGPFVLAHGLVKQNECLENRRFTGSIRTRQKCQICHWKLQTIEAFEVLQVDFSKH